MITITENIHLPESEIIEEFIRASGPGGQNVNKVATAVQIRLDVRNSPSLPDDVKERLKKVAGRKMTTDGVLIIEAKRFRTQGQNREDAINRLIVLIQKASEKPKKRHKSRVSKSAKLNRLSDKRKQSEKKRWRRIDPGTIDDF